MKTAILQSFKKKKRTVDSKGGGTGLPLPGSATDRPASSSSVRMADSGPRGTDTSTGCCTQAAWGWDLATHRWLGDRHWRARRALKGWPLCSE